MLHCRPNSHPFNDRTLSLEQAVKIGRSVARARATPGNTIFDCKVLSRNHALLWYENGKFYLQDTKSSNGTFVNNQRLSKGSEESPPREVCSGDILQFGVDVMENSKKVTHGCIIATLKLYLPDGKEAKASPTIVNGANNPALLSLSLPTQDLYQLNQYIQEALAREQLLETKLAVLQRLVGQTETASSDAWKSLIDEDRLLTRVEILESQLSAYSKCMTEDKLRDEAQRLMEEKEEYQEVAKDTLKKLVDEKLEAVKKMQDLEKQLSTTEDEFAVLKELYEKNAEESKELASEVSKLREELENVRQKIPPEPEPESKTMEGTTEKAASAIETTEATSQENKSEEEQKQVEGTDDEASRASELSSESSNTTLAEPSLDDAVVTREVLGKQETIVSTVGRDEESQNEVVSALRAQLSELTTNEQTLRTQFDKCKSQWESERRDILAEKDELSRKVEDDEVRSLKAQLEEERELRRRSQVELQRMATASDNDETAAGQVAAAADEELDGSALDVSLNDSLAEAEEKIAQLLKVKERYAEERE